MATDFSLNQYNISKEFSAPSISDKAKKETTTADKTVFANIMNSAINTSQTSSTLSKTAYTPIVSSTPVITSNVTSKTNYTTNVLSIPTITSSVTDKTDFISNVPTTSTSVFTPITTTFTFTPIVPTIKPTFMPSVISTMTFTPAFKPTFMPTFTFAPSFTPVLIPAFTPSISVLPEDVELTTDKELKPSIDSKEKVEETSNTKMSSKDIAKEFVQTKTIFSSKETARITKAEASVRESAVPKKEEGPKTVKTEGTEGTKVKKSDQTRESLRRPIEAKLNINIIKNFDGKFKLEKFLMNAFVKKVNDVGENAKNKGQDNNAKASDAKREEAKKQEQIQLRKLLLSKTRDVEKNKRQAHPIEEAAAEVGSRKRVREKMAADNIKKIKENSIKEVKKGKYTEEGLLTRRDIKKRYVI